MWMMDRGAYTGMAAGLLLLLVVPPALLRRRKWVGRAPVRVLVRVIRLLDIWADGLQGGTILERLGGRDERFRIILTFTSTCTLVRQRLNERSSKSRSIEALSNTFSVPRDVHLIYGIYVLQSELRRSRNPSELRRSP